jgi:hypothetical protein
MHDGTWRMIDYIFVRGVCFASHVLSDPKLDICHRHLHYAFAPVPLKRKSNDVIWLVRLFLLKKRAPQFKTYTAR